MNIADSVQETTAGTSTSAITVNGAASGFRSFAAAVTSGELVVGQTVPLRVEDDAGNWLTGEYTLTSSTVLTRSKIGASSAGGANVTLAGSVRRAMLAPTKGWADSLKLPSQPAFSTVIPLDVPGLSIPAPKTLTGALTLTVPASLAPGAQVYQRVIGDGASSVTVVGALKLNISADFDSRSGIENQFQFFNDASGNPKYCISQVEGAIPVDGVAPQLSNPTATQTGPNTANGTVVTDEANGTLWCLVSANATETGAAIRAGGTAQTVTAAGTKTFNIVGLAASTLYYLHFAHRDLSNNDSNVANSASFTTAAAAAVPSTMAAPVITAGDGQISIAWTQPAMNGGTFQDATFTASTGQTVTGTTSPTVMTVPNGTPVTVTGKARNSIGTAAAASPASNSVTPASAAFSPLRLTTLTNYTESGTAPNNEYTGTIGYSSTPLGGSPSQSFPGDFEVYFDIINSTAGKPIMGFSDTPGVKSYANIQRMVFADGAGYGSIGAIAPASSTPGIVPAVIDRVYAKRVGTVLTYSKSANQGAGTRTQISQFTGVTGTQYLQLASEVGATRVSTPMAIGAV